MAALVAALIVGLIYASLQASTDPFQALPLPPGTPEPSTVPTDVLRQAGLTALQFLPVSTTVELPTLETGGQLGPFGGGLEMSFSFAGSLMLGTLLVGWLLFLGGRSVARASGGAWWARAVHGAKVAVPYAVLTLVLSLLTAQEIEIPGGPAGFPGGAVEIRPSPLSAFLWPFMFGMVVGVAGGLGTARETVMSSRWARWVWSALAGGWRMAWVGVALAFVGFLVVAAVHPQQTRAYFDLVGRLGWAGGSWLVLTTALILPNTSTWILSGATGGSAVSVDLFGSSCTVLSYWQFPAGVQDTGAPLSPDLSDPCGLLLAAFRFETAPVGYFLFLLVPVVATLLGGWLTARRLGAGRAGQGAAVGAAAGAGFMLFAVGLMLLSRFSVEVHGPAALFLGGSGIAFGPGLLAGLLLALLWGAVGGAAGGWLGSRRPQAEHLPLPPPAGPQLPTSPG